MKKYNSHSKRYSAKKPTLGQRIVSEALGLSLLAEKIGTKAKEEIYDGAIKIGCLAAEYGCLGGTYNATTKFQKTATYMAVAGLTSIVVKKSIERIVSKC